MSWQPIETAPKDGAHIILLIDGNAIEGWWDPCIGYDGKVYDIPYWDVVRLSSHGCGCCSGRNDDPTAWMHLPPSAS